MDLTISLPTVKQLTLSMRQPALIRSRDWQHPGICSRCGRFSFRTGRLFLPGKSLKGLRRKTAPKTRLCASCLTSGDGSLKPGAKNRITPTLAVQLLGYGCPRAYQLRVENPKQPSSSGNAFGTVYHWGRQLCESKTLSKAGFFWSKWGLKSIIAKLRTDTFFPHGVATQNSWEIEAMSYYLDQVFRMLWQHDKLVSVKSFGEKLEKQTGSHLVWWQAEMRLPGVTVSWLGDDLRQSTPDADNWSFRGAIDLITLTENQGKYQVKIIDHKVEGIDVHKELNAKDCQTQLSLYACWAVKAFAGLGVKPEDVCLWVHKLSLNPMILEKVNLPFNDLIYRETLDNLVIAIKTYDEYRRSGFPAHPSHYQCQGCDFGFATNLCSHSQAKRASWNLGVPYVPMTIVRTKEEIVSRRRDLGKCPFCGSPMEKGKYGAVCSSRLYDDCPREDR